MNVDRYDAYQLASIYLMASYLYYELDISPMSDSEYDEVCKRLLKWKKYVKHHPHYELLEDEALRAGTGYQLVGNFPLRVIGAANHWYIAMKGDKGEAEIIRKRSAARTTVTLTGRSVRRGQRQGSRVRDRG